MHEFWEIMGEIKIEFPLSLKIYERRGVTKFGSELSEISFTLAIFLV